MIERTLKPRLLELAASFPVITLTGPRQSGKTTLCRALFGNLPYVSLENPSERAFALEDPEGFLARFPAGAVLDEIQRAPDLPSYLQGLVDEDPAAGRFVLTGSQNLALVASVTQSLAGRSAIAHLLPLALEELAPAAPEPSNLWRIVWTGGYPRIYDRGLPADEWLASYVAAYAERDVRQVLNIGDLVTFQTFLRLCAGRVGQVSNLSSLGNDSGVTHTTARNWLSVLEATFIAFRTPPFHRNLGKRLIKSPKLYFYDTGVLSHLLGIESPEQLATHPLRGAIFENWVVAEIAKYAHHRGRQPRLSFYRDQRGLEVDVIVERGDHTKAIEVKSSATPSVHFFDALEAFRRLDEEAGNRLKLVGIVVYGGSATQLRRPGRMVSWQDIDEVDW
jgi:uncharacterized protein